MSDQQAIDTICREIHRVRTMYDNALNQEGDGAFTARLQLIGEIIGLQKALCVLMGWPLEEAQHEGKADEYAAEWAEARA